MSLPDNDLAYLRDRAFKHEVTEESSMTCIVFTGFALPSGFDRTTADLLVRLPAGYPDLAPDMWWFDPGVHTSDGQAIKATEASEIHLGRTWQRWSRHFEAGQWQSGIDGLESFMALIVHELNKSALKVV